MNVLALDTCFGACSVAVRWRSQRHEWLLREAYEEHKEIKSLLTALEETEPEDAEYAAKVKALKQRVEHHVKEEEGEMFPDAEKLLGDDKLQSLGEEIAALKEEVGYE